MSASQTYIFFLSFTRNVTFIHVFYDLQGNVTKTVTIVVIDSNAPQCEKNTTKTNKGVYMWEATVAGVTKELPCKLGDGMITHLCDKQGRWTNLNHTACGFTNELTRKLKNLAEVKTSV